MDLHDLYNQYVAGDEKNNPPDDIEADEAEDDDEDDEDDESDEGDEPESEVTE